MGAEPSTWGTGKNAAPVSITQDDKVPTPRADVLNGRRARCSTTRRRRTPTGRRRWTCRSAAATRAVQYTLTSVRTDAKAPTGWTLQGSADGTTWRTLDRRSGESFRWDRQTRAFTVRTPGSYAQYRLVLDGESTLAEVELLA